MNNRLAIATTLWKRHELEKVTLAQWRSALRMAGALVLVVLAGCRSQYQKDLNTDQVGQWCEDQIQSTPIYGDGDFAMKLETAQIQVMTNGCYVVLEVAAKAP